MPPTALIFAFGRVGVLGVCCSVDSAEGRKCGWRGGVCCRPGMAEAAPSASGGWSQNLGILRRKLPRRDLGAAVNVRPTRSKTRRHILEGFFFDSITERGKGCFTLSGTQRSASHAALAKRGRSICISISIHFVMHGRSQAEQHRGLFHLCSRRHAHFNAFRIVDRS